MRFGAKALETEGIAGKREAEKPHVAVERHWKAGDRID